MKTCGTRVVGGKRRGRRRKLQSTLVLTTSESLPTSVIQLRTSFRRCLAKFRQLQTQYQPDVVPLLAKLPAVDLDLDTVQDTPLYLPSSLPPEPLNKCSKRLVSMETELRIGQCCDSLIQLRTKLNAQACLLKYNYVHVRRVKGTTAGPKADGGNEQGIGTSAIGREGERGGLDWGAVRDMGVEIKDEMMAALGEGGSLISFVPFGSLDRVRPALRQGRMLADQSRIMKFGSSRSTGYVRRPRLLCRVFPFFTIYDSAVPIVKSLGLGASVIGVDRTWTKVEGLMSRQGSYSENGVFGF